MSNIKWNDVSQFLGLKSSDEWPDSFEAEHISKMQRPDNISGSQALCKTIVAACKVSHLKHTVSVEIRRRPAPAAADPSSTLSLIRAALVDTSYEATIYRITAPDLENWMLKQRVAPSEYLSWWFESASTVHDDAAMMAPVGAAGDSPAKRRTWRDVAWPYMVNVFKSGQYATAKEFYRALETKAGAGSPFETGTGANRGSLFVREISEKLTLKTVQNTAWPQLKNS